MSSKRVILDTNLWISFLISKDLKVLDKLIDNKEVVFVFSRELIDEFIAVAQRPKFQDYFTNDDLAKLLLLFNRYGRLVQVTSDLKICRDSKDNFLLNLAVDSKADYLITGDGDLLVLGKVGKTSIITIKELFAILK